MPFFSAYPAGVSVCGFTIVIQEQLAPSEAASDSRDDMNPARKTAC
jgi:hypothetical protein